MRLPRKIKPEADLNVTSFMNLMIVLVPVLLLNMVFSQLATLELHLPLDSDDDPVLSEEVSLEVVIRAQEFEITRTYKEETKSILTLPKEAGEYDYQGLSTALQDIKKDPVFAEKTDISLLSEPDISYQTLVTVMDKVRIYPAVVAASKVDAVLFPDMSLGEAPEVTE